MSATKQKANAKIHFHEQELKRWRSFLDTLSELEKEEVDESPAARMGRPRANASATPLLAKFLEGLVGEITTIQIWDYLSNNGVSDRNQLMPAVWELVESKQLDVIERPKGRKVGIFKILEDAT